jgi:hypothetical protein
MDAVGPSSGLSVATTTTGSPATAGAAVVSDPAVPGAVVAACQDGRVELPLHGCLYVEACIARTRRRG